MDPEKIKDLPDEGFNNLLREILSEARRRKVLRLSEAEIDEILQTDRYVDMLSEKDRKALIES
jgi:ribosomal protein L15